ncbi:mitochondrial fission 1 protein A-like [Pistacia vera]|uniref:mitochondrial fission 1 protein A-like n=1 Tax=Pistacia vera TaxID=55513 RepID=UPI0012639CA5|nr:mitochondrial fission 1 protein A-like [Pistacia vera]
MADKTSQLEEFATNTSNNLNNNNSPSRQLKAHIFADRAYPLLFLHPFIFSLSSDICWQGCEREVAEAANGDSDKLKSESIMRLSWALVHSRQAEDVQRGIAMLEASLANSSPPLQQREKLYLLAVGYYRCGDYSRSRQLVEQCLEIAPDWRQALALKKSIEDRIAKDGVIGIGITATAVGLIAGGIAAALARKK